jgi:chorismate mutase
LHEKILNDNDYIKRIKKIKRKKDKIENKELLDLNEIIFNDEEKIREVVIKPREEIIINREQEFDDDIINSVMDNIFSDNIDKERKDNLDKMYNQIPMVGGKFDDIS